MPKGVFRRSQPVALNPERIMPEAVIFRLFVAEVPTNLLIACLWAVGMAASALLALPVAPDGVPSELFVSG